MRLSNRSFPHPVVGNGDDVPGAEFQATFEFASDRTNFYIDIAVQCSSRTLLKMIGKGDACYTLHVECGNTLFRASYDFDKPKARVVIPATKLNDAVEVNAFVRANVAVKKYAVDGAHPDYAGATFAVGPGDILAVGDSQEFPADHTIDPLRRIGALMVVEKSPKAGPHPMEADFGGEKIRILLCEEDFVAYNETKVDPLLTRHLTTTLVLPVLMQAVILLGEGSEDYAGLKWADLIRRRLDGLGLAQGTDPLEKAQRLLDLPIRRALSAAHEYLARSVP